MTGKRDGVKEGWMDGRRAEEEAEINAAKTPACAGKLRIGQHVNLNPSMERRKHTGRENRGLSGKERDVRSLSSRSLLHPFSLWSASCRQRPGNPSEPIWSQPFNHTLHLTWHFLLPHPLSPMFDSSPFTSSLLTVTLPNSSVWTPPLRLESSLTESSFTEYSLLIWAFPVSDSCAPSFLRSYDPSPEFFSPFSSIFRQEWREYKGKSGKKEKSHHRLQSCGRYPALHPKTPEILVVFSTLLKWACGNFRQFQPTIQPHLHSNPPPLIPRPVGEWWSMVDWLARQARVSNGGLTYRKG